MIYIHVLNRGAAGVRSPMDGPLLSVMLVRIKLTHNQRLGSGTCQHHGEPRWL